MIPTLQRPIRGQHPHQQGAWLFPALLFATFFQNYYDLTAIFSGEKLALYSYEGPLLYKIGKDLLYVAILIAILVHARKFRVSPLTDYSVAIILVIALMYLISAVVNGPVIATLGLRWALPFMLFLLLRKWGTALNIESASLWILVGMVFCFSAQLYQIFHMPPVFGEIFPGVAARTPGIFVAPNSAAFFACASAACIMVFRPKGPTIRAAAVLLALFISILAQSGTGIVVSTILMFRVMARKKPLFFWILTIVALSFSIPNLDILTQRDDYVEVSGGGRLEVLFDIADRYALSVSNFGVFTNAANLLSENPEHQIAADSLLASWMGNFGVASVLVLGLSALFVAFRMRQVEWGRAAPAVIVFAIFSLTTIVFEAFPMNIYIAIALWSARSGITLRPRKRPSL